MNVCRNCKHWDRDGKAGQLHETLVNEDTCEFKEAPQRRCLRMACAVVNVEPEAREPFLKDAEGRGAVLWTPAEWSCPGFAGNESWVVEFRSGTFFQDLDHEVGGPKESAQRFGSKGEAYAFMAKHEWMILNGGLALEVK